MKQYQDHQHKISSNRRQKNRPQEIQVKKARAFQNSCFLLKCSRKSYIYYSKIGTKLRKQMKTPLTTKNFLHNVTPFILNAFIKYLQPNPQHKEMLENIQNFKRQKESKQQKFELGDLRYLLIQEKSHVRAFKQAFQTFLKSSFLQEYIQNNQKIRNQEKKQLYLNSVQLFLEEIEKRQKIFVKFISDTNAKKIVEYWNEIMYSQNSQNNSFNQVESIPNGEDQTPYLDQEPRKRDILETSSQDHIISQEYIDFQNFNY